MTPGSEEVSSPENKPIVSPFAELDKKLDILELVAAGKSSSPLEAKALNYIIKAARKKMRDELYLSKHQYFADFNRRGYQTICSIGGPDQFVQATLDMLGVANSEELIGQVKDEVGKITDPSKKHLIPHSGIVPTTIDGIHVAVVARRPKRGNDHPGHPSPSQVTPEGYSSLSINFDVSPFFYNKVMKKLPDLPPMNPLVDLQVRSPLNL